MRSLLRGKARSSSTEEVLARWPSAPAGNCDICNTRIGSESGHRISAKEFKEIAGRGYNPFARGRGTAQAQMVAFLWGRSPADATPDALYARWRPMVAVDSTDWGLCEACAKDVASFVLRAS